MAKTHAGFPVNALTMPATTTVIGPVGPEPVAVLDTFSVHSDFRRRGIGTALLEQLCKNLEGLGVRSLHTEVSWDDPTLLTFFQRQGFRPAERFCLDLNLDDRCGAQG